MDRKLSEAFRHCLLVGKNPYFLDKEYTDFLLEVYRRLKEAPFSSNLSSASLVCKITIINICHTVLAY